MTISLLCMYCRCVLLYLNEYNEFPHEQLHQDYHDSSQRNDTKLHHIDSIYIHSNNPCTHIVMTQYQLFSSVQSICSPLSFGYIG